MLRVDISSSGEHGGGILLFWMSTDQVKSTTDCSWSVSLIL